jgi:DNA/RNA-binding domain of Phe-tRNA-synthetase-like protein
MTPLTYTIAPEIFTLHPGYCRGVVVARGFTNGPSAPAVTALLREAEAALRQRITGNVAEVPEIAAWREAYRRFGAKPSEHRSAIEALARRVLKPDNLPAINTLVDIGKPHLHQIPAARRRAPHRCAAARRGPAPGPARRQLCPA